MILACHVRSQATWPFLGGVAQAGGQFSRDLANPQVGAAGTSAADVRPQPMWRILS
jgi:hypothetical protein